jgi:hypothetical protein
MPGAVEVASPIGVMPVTLSTQFSRMLTYEGISNQFADGSVIASALVGAPRGQWNIPKRLTATQYNALLAWFTSTKGMQIPFYFYDPFETSPLFTSDPTGVALTGRYIVRLNNNLSQVIDLGRTTVQCSLIEVY